MKKIITASVKESTADLLKKLATESVPSLSQSAIVDYAIQTVDLTKFKQEENSNGSKKESSSKEKTGHTSSKEKKVN